MYLINDLMHNVLVREALKTVKEVTKNQTLFERDNIPVDIVVVNHNKKQWRRSKEQELEHRSKIMKNHYVNQSDLRRN